MSCVVPLLPCLQPNQCKDALLKPTFPFSSTALSNLLTSSDDNTSNQSKIPKLYMCNSRSDFTVIEVQNSRCAYFRSNMSCEVKLTKWEVHLLRLITALAFVKEVVTYMVWDDLVIQPMSTISSITLLNQFNVKEVGVLKEKVFKLGMAEGMLLWLPLYMNIKGVI